MPSQSDLILDYFKKHPMRDIEHEEWIDEISDQYEQLTGKRPRDLWRAARKLHQSGYLIKIKNGVYRYDPDSVFDKQLEDFTDAQKKEILERDDYKCVICGRGRAEGMALHVDHIKPKDLGGKAIIANGQTLCAQHNFIKKNNNATESGKKMFIRLYELAKEENNTEMIAFCTSILETYELHSVNGHIEWEK